MLRQIIMDYIFRHEGGYPEKDTLPTWNVTLWYIKCDIKFTIWKHVTKRGRKSNEHQRNHH